MDEIAEGMEQFTNEELERINQLYGNDFKGITADDASLIARWERDRARFEALASRKAELMQQETAAKIEIAKQEYADAKARLDELHALAVKNYGD